MLRFSAPGDGLLRIFQQRGGQAGPNGGAWSDPVLSKRSLPLQKPVA